jgi:hypothetical protein
MDYKEFHQECYELLIENLGREPTWTELEEFVRDSISILVGAYEDN